MKNWIELEIEDAAKKRVWWLQKDSDKLESLLIYLYAQGAKCEDVEYHTISDYWGLFRLFREVQTIPMMGEFRIVVVQMGDKFDQSKFYKPLMGLPEYSRLIIVFEQYPIRLARRLEPFVARLFKTSSEEMLEYVQEEISSYGQRITADAKNMLVEAYPSRERLRAEIFKLTTVCQRALITGKDLDLVLATPSAQELLAALRRGNFERAFRIASEWYQRSGSCNELLSALSSLIRSLTKIKWAYLTEHETIRVLKTSPNRAQELHRLADDFDLSLLRTWLKRLAKHQMSRGDGFSILVGLLNDAKTKIKTAA